MAMCINTYIDLKLDKITVKDLRTLSKWLERLTTESSERNLENSHVEGLLHLQ